MLLPPQTNCLPVRGYRSSEEYWTIDWHSVVHLQFCNIDWKSDITPHPVARVSQQVQSLGISEVDEAGKIARCVDTRRPTPFYVICSALVIPVLACKLPELRALSSSGRQH